MKIVNTIFLLIPCFAVNMMFSQNNDSLRQASIDKRKQKKEIKKNSPTFLVGQLGVNSLRFTDFATSPLRYKGLGTSLALGREKRIANRVKEGRFQYTIGLPSAQADQAYSNSLTNLFYLDLSRLYTIKDVLPDKWVLEAGFLLSSVTSVRYNSSLQNNSLGYELFLNGMGSAKITKKFSRKEASVKKIWFINFKLKPKNRSISFRFDPGIINTSVRNGFAYIGQSAILNDFKLFDNYNARLFSGLRFKTTLDYTKQLKNGNEVKWSYSWDALTTGRDIDDFQLANHLLGVSLLFKTK